MTSRTENSGGGTAQTIEELQKRYQSLNEKKIRSETNLKHARDTLESLKEQARKQFGTDDVAELRAKLDEMTAENNRKREEYQAQLDTIERELTEIDARFSPERDEEPSK